MSHFITKIAVTCMLAVTFTGTVLSATKTAIFAAGCFWCVEADFDKVPGVIKTISGYTGGYLKNPSYRQVSRHTTGHFEAVKVYYNTHKTSYKKLLKVYWKNVDPADPHGQFCDKGSSYRSAIFYQGKRQQRLAKRSKQTIVNSHRFKQVVTDVLPAAEFYPAEKYHQNYYKKNPLRYKIYRKLCGRDRHLQKIWQGV